MIAINADSNNRWSTFLNSGCSEATELNRAWDILTSEAKASAEWLEQDLENVFDRELASFSEGSKTGEIRMDITSTREKTRALLLKKSLQYHSQKARHVLSWKQRDELSSS